MADPEKFQSEKEIRMDWGRLRAGLFGGLIGWLIAIALITPPFLIYYPSPSQKLNRIMQAAFLVPIFVLGMYGHWVATSRYNRRRAQQKTD